MRSDPQVLKLAIRGGGAQAVENVVSGERYKQITDEAIKYVLGYYGEPAAPVDQNIVDRVMSLPRTKAFLNWEPEGYLKSVKELRQEIGPELSDDDLLVKILIPGKPVKRVEPKKTATPPVIKATAPVSPPTDFPTEFTVDVDGEARFDGAEEALEVVQRERRVQPALDEDLRAPQVQELLDLAEDRLARKDIPPVLAGQPIKVAEFTLDPADVRVVDDPADDVRDAALGVQPEPDQARPCRELEGVRFTEEAHPVVEGQPFAHEDLVLNVGQIPIGEWHGTQRSALSDQPEID